MEIKASAHQLKALTSKKKFIFLGAGVGSGKTWTGALWHLNKLTQTPEGTLGLIVANTYSQLFDSTLRAVYKLYSNLNLKVSPAILPRNSKPFNIFVEINGRKVEILCRSLDNFESLSGMEIGWFWADEVWQTIPEAMEVLFARLRDTNMKDLQGLLTTTLDDPSSWMYKMFVKEYNPEFQEVIYAKTHDNQKNLPKGYIEGLQSAYSAALYDRMVLAKWVSLSHSRVYYNFDRKTNVDESIVYDPNLPLLWAWDFNIGVGKPMSTCLAQIRKGKGPDGMIRTEIHIVEEIILEGVSTDDMIAEFKESEYAMNQKIIVYGDASGHARDTRSKKSDYDILYREGFKNQKVPRSNPSVRERHNIVNTLLKAKNGDVRIKIHPRCKTLIEGMEMTKLKSGSQYIEDDNVYSQHVTTALGYLICNEFPLYTTKLTKFGI